MLVAAGVFEAVPAVEDPLEVLPPELPDAPEESEPELELLGAEPDPEALPAGTDELFSERESVR